MIMKTVALKLSQMKSTNFLMLKLKNLKEQFGLLNDQVNDNYDNYILMGQMDFI